MPKSKPKKRAARQKKIPLPVKMSEIRVPQQKAAVRSRAFGKAILHAREYTANRQRLAALFKEAARRSAALPKEPFRDTWAYFQAMLRLLDAYSRGEYRKVQPGALLSIVAAINYLVDPFDLIPDEIPFLGFLDDATVVAFAVARTRGTLDDFMSWEIKKLLAAD